MIDLEDSRGQPDKRKTFLNVIIYTEGPHNVDPVVMRGSRYRLDLPPRVQLPCWHDTDSE